VAYSAFKVVHLFGVVLFLGNIIVTALWKVMADRTGDPRVIAYAQRLVILTDFIFTAGGIVLILVGAYGMAAVAGLDLRGKTWLVWGQVLFVASGLIWTFILIPTQIAQAAKRAPSPAANRFRIAIGGTTDAGWPGASLLQFCHWRICILWFSSRNDFVLSETFAGGLVGAWARLTFSHPLCVVDTL